MKKQLLSIFAALTISSALAQTPSPSWTIAQNPSFTTATVPVAGTRFLDAVDANVVWLGGYNGNAANANYNWFSRTINGGTSYNSGNIFADTNTFILSNMEGVNANTAWVCSFKKPSQSGGAIHSTIDGGTSWQNMTPVGMFTNTAASFGNFVSFLTPQNGIVNGDPIGTSPNPEFELWTTANGGTSWTQVPGANIPNPLAAEYAIVNLYCKDGASNLWFGTNKGRVYRTTDAGLNWNASSLSGAITNTVLDLAFSGPLNGLVLSFNGTTSSLWNTIDGGATWNLINGGVLPNNFGANEMSGIPGTTYFASVDNANGNLSYSLDNGATWISWNSMNISYLTIDFVNAFTAWVGGFQGAPVSFPGIFKYNGITFNSIFNVPLNVCKPGATVTVTPSNNSNGSAPLTFSWSAQPTPLGAIFSSNTASVPVITFSANGTYTISLLVTNSQGQPATSTQIINVLSCGSPTPGFNIPSTVCNNSAFTLTNTSSGAPMPTYTVSTSSPSSSTITPGANAQLRIIRFATPGTYSINLIASSVAGTMSITKTITVIDCSPVPNFTLPAIAANCIDIASSATAIATNTTTLINPPITYVWSVLPTAGVQLSNCGANCRLLDFTSSGSYTVTLVATNASGSNSISKTVIANICVGLSENKGMLSNLNVFPNPAHDHLNLVLPTSSDVYKIKLVNVVGAVVYEEKTVKNSKEIVTINLTNKAKGIYFLIVESNSDKAAKKIVVE